MSMSSAALRFTLLVTSVAACGGSQPAARAGDPPGVVQDTRTELEQRRDAGCEALQPRLVQCAVDDARAELDAGRMTKPDFDANTSPDVRAKLGAEWMKACQVEMSSRQVRVLEVCFKEETTCGPLLSCLGHLTTGAK
ncbi:MAG: hypothetical protein M3680_07590 [Myxococcota bacterium]|nr:hypothetical protein [Myxococcota bacterium]